MTSRFEKNKKQIKKIEKDEKRKKNKAIFLNFIKIFFGTLIIILCITSYIYYVSTNIFTVREYSNVYTTLPKEYHGLKIIQFGDLYYNNNYSIVLKNIAKKINILNPDLVIFSGGLLNKNYKINPDSKKLLTQCLSDIKASLGKYYIIGDSDNNQSIEILNNSNFKSLNDETELIYLKSTTPILLHGIKNIYDIDYKNNNYFFKINILHDATKIDKILNYNNPEIIMTGKTLNSQIRIPYHEKIFKGQNPIKYQKYYRINNTDVFITGGIGTNNIPVRIFNHPSINFYRLRSY